MRSSTLVSSIIPHQSPLPWRRSPRCIRHSQNRCAYSSLPNSPLLQVRSIPAPHTGYITILTLSSPINKNAISRRLLDEFSAEIKAIREQWDFHSKGMRAGVIAKRMEKFKNLEKPSETPNNPEEEGSEGEGVEVKHKNHSKAYPSRGVPPGGALVPRPGRRPAGCASRA